MLPLILWLSLDWKAEFCGHSVPHAGTTYFTADYLVFEVEVLPDKASPIRLGASQFRLRLNGRKELLPSESPGTVAGSLKYGDWSQRPGVEAQAGPVILGGPRQNPRFPGDRQPGTGRPDIGRPAPQTNSTEKDPPKTDAEAVVEAAMPEGPTLGPTKGLIYFPYRGKMKSLKSIELIWEERVLKLR